MAKAKKSTKSLKRRVKCSMHNYCHLNFYRLHFIYFILAIITGSGILYSSNATGFSLAYIDAIYLCASAMCNVGLNPVNLGSLTGFQQSILFVLMLMGDMSLVTISVVVVRRYYFSKQISDLVQRSEAAWEIAEDIERQRQGRYGNADTSGQASSSARAEDQVAERFAQPQSTVMPLRSWKRSQADYVSSHLRGYGAFPAPWEWRRVKHLLKLLTRSEKNDVATQHSHLSFAPRLDHKGRSISLKPGQEEELGGVEYRALKVLTWLLPGYCIFWLFIVMVVMAPYAAHSSVANTIRSAQPGNLSPAWWSVFVTVSAYSNNGLNLLNENMIPLAHDYLVLTFTGAAILAGKSLYPVFLRFFVWLLSKCVRRDTELHHSLTFLLQYPRRCFLLLFPRNNTWILFATQVAIDLLAWVFWNILNIGQPSVDPGIPAGQRVMDGLFQALGVRSGGLYIIHLSTVAPALQFLYLALMYTSAFPLIMSLRRTNIYEDRSLGQDDATKFGRDDRDTQSAQPSRLSIHIRRQLSYDLWWLCACIFLISIIEHTNLSTGQPGFSLFSVMFETISAYGTVGLSLGVPYDDYSFSGAWHVLSKLVLLTVMLRGRHRILPMAVDRAVLLPGQELMEKLDREYQGSVEKRRDLEARIRDDEKGEQVEMPRRKRRDLQ